MTREPTDLRRLADAVEHLSDDAGILIEEVRALAREEARTVIRRSQDRQKALLASTLWAACASAIVAVLLTVTIMDVHTHRGHVEPLEIRVSAIESLIEQVDEMTGGELPDLDGQRYATGDLHPLQPAPEQAGAPAGTLIYGLGAVGLLLSALGWWRARKALIANPSVVRATD